MSTHDEVVIPLFTKGLKTLDHILTKAESYAKEKGLDADAIFPSQNATKTVKTTLGHLTGSQSAPFEDKEKTIEDLHAKIRETLELLKGPFEAKKEEVVDVPFEEKVLKISAKNAALSQGVPNFFSHLNTAYSVLRAKGVPIGKSDYIGSFLAQ